MAKKAKGYKMGKETKKAFGSLMSKQPAMEAESKVYKMPKDVKAAAKSVTSKKEGMAVEEGKAIRGYESVFMENMNPNGKPQYAPVEKPAFNKNGYNGSDSMSSEDEVDAEAAKRRARGLPVDTEEGETTRDSLKRWKRGK